MVKGLSVSTLKLFVECPRCFWMDKAQGVERPRGIFPSLPSGIDKVMKAHVESEMASGHFAYLTESDAMPYKDRARVLKFRNWRTFQANDVIDGVAVKCWGELDELLVHVSNRVSPWDYKSRGSAPENTEDYSKKYNQLQVDVYDYLLTMDGLETTGYGYFTYIWPLDIKIISGAHLIQFGHETCKIKTDRNHAREVLKQATLCLVGPCPKSSPDCEYCAFVSQRGGL